MIHRRHKSSAGVCPRRGGRRHAHALACVALLALVSCTHIEVALPGVLDLRSDASELDVDKHAAKGTRGEREGLSAMFGGDGVKAAGPNVTVEGRVWWLTALIRLSDGDVSDGLRTGLAGSTAMRDVVITEEVTAAEAITFYCGLPIPCAAAFLPTRTVRASGTRVVAPAGESAP